MGPDYPPSDEVGEYYWGTCGKRVQFSMSVVSYFMTDAEKKMIWKRIAKWHNKHGANYVDKKGERI